MNINTKKTNKSIGNFGEKTACDFLKKQGYKIIETNYHYSKLAEIDIIAKEKNTIVFVEVKARLNDRFGMPREAINYKKQQKIRRTAEFYLISNNLNDKNCRFDCVEIVGNREDFTVEHFKNAF